MDNGYRKSWDKTLAVHEQLEVDISNGTEIGRIIKKFPLLTAREYILAWRVWEAKDGTFYCLTKVSSVKSIPECFCQALLNIIYLYWAACEDAMNTFAFISVFLPPSVLHCRCLLSYGKSSYMRKHYVGAKVFQSILVSFS